MTENTIDFSPDDENDSENDPYTQLVKLLHDDGSIESARIESDDWSHEPHRVEHEYHPLQPEYECAGVAVMGPPEVAVMKPAEARLELRFEAPDPAINDMVEAFMNSTTLEFVYETTAGTIRFDDHWMITDINPTDLTGDGKPTVTADLIGAPASKHHGSLSIVL